MAEECLIDETFNVFSDKDNESFLSFPNEEEVKKVLDKANLCTAPGTDGIPSLLYHKCWNTLGIHLTDVVKAIHFGEVPTKSMRSSLMVFWV